ncbi:MAG: phosphotriesterase [Chitinophagaceae bacterium]|nr:phosphotriesterase [Chitinophagaceae bacterium]
MASRKEFIAQSACMMAGYFVFAKMHLHNSNQVMTVNGWMNADKMGFTLTHEHVLVDFAGADKIDPSRYDAEEVFRTALPKLLSVKEKGCKTFIECTPNYIGRDVKLLKRLSEASGLTILTNTGYYGAAGEKYLPAHAYTETAEQLAKRWIAEWENGIDGSGIRPGFIKSGVDNYPLSAAQKKIVEATAITHLATGLTIGIHTGNGQAAMEELRIIQSKGVAPQAWIWIHAQNETNRDVHMRAAKAGGWVSFDNINNDSVPSCLSFLKNMKDASLLDQVLLSHDSGWYHVGESQGGNYNDYNTIFDKLIPAMKENGFTEKDLQQLFFINPSRALAVSVRKK